MSWNGHPDSICQRRKKLRRRHLSKRSEDRLWEVPLRNSPFVRKARSKNSDDVSHPPQILVFFPHFYLIPYI